MKVHFLKRCLQCVSGGKLTLTKIPLLNLFTLEIERIFSTIFKSQLHVKNVSSLNALFKVLFQNHIF